MMLTRLIATIATLSLLGQVYINLGKEPDLGTTIWNMLRYFTIVVNLLIAVVFIRASVTRRLPGAGLSAALTTYIIVVGSVYHALLARNHPFGTLDFFTDHGLHTIVPILMVIWWASIAHKKGLRWSGPAKWIGVPVGYLIYVMIRGLTGDIYPYFFIDVETLGIVATLMNVAGLALLFYLLGLMLVGVGRVIGR
ncbi:hypothetical protein FHS89_002053 [Rubricella aquisinus]|uniref:FAR-17a/AIG1-like protein n=1 Tax=Rubricella aquisinus TaxID=2028108 RepID=A0A840WPN7_9RHOB|nr:Pr6Pr family membrane protein [Rubricella aquisinus]MBB5516033.1 hypothetical protein [Rubricella aquisinus]